MTRPSTPRKESRGFRELWAEQWFKFVSFLVPFLFDVAIGSLIFVALLWFHWLFKLGALVGLRADYIDGFEKFIIG